MEIRAPLWPVRETASTRNCRCQIDDGNIIATPFHRQSGCREYQGRQGSPLTITPRYDRVNHPVHTDRDPVVRWLKEQQRQGRTRRAIAEDLGVNPSTVTRNIEKMETDESFGPKFRKGY